MKKRLKRVLAFMLALVLVCVGLIPYGTTTVRADDSKTVTFKRGSEVHYVTYSTFHHMLSDGTNAYCLEPEKNPPVVGTEYTAYPLDNDLMRTLLYYGESGPGYNDPGLGLRNRMPDELSDDIGYVYTHMLLAYVYDDESEDSDAFKGLTDAYSGTVEGLKAILNVYKGFTNSVPSNFRAYIVNCGESRQNMAFYEILPTGDLTLQKTSQNASITDGNACYSLAGAVYKVYTDAACSTTPVATLTTTEGGSSNTVTLTEGTYYVKEETASLGFELDPTVYPITVTAGNTATVNSVEPVGNDPYSIMIRKMDAQTGNTIQGGGNLAGAQFTIRYYDGFYAKDTLPAAATRTWVIETKYNEATGEYGAFLSDGWLVSGDALYKTAEGNTTLPLGTITVQETKAPAGYLIAGNTISAGGTTATDNLFLTQITSTDAGVSVVVGNLADAQDKVIHGGVTMTKYDRDFNTNNPQGNASLAGAEYELINNNPNPIIVDGQTIAPGAVITTLVTDATGKASTAADYLPYGSYYLKEKTASTGYLVSTEQYDFNIVEDNTLTSVTVYEDVKKGTVGVQKYDAESGLTTPQGGGSFEGIVYTVTNASSKPIYVNGTKYNNGEVVATMTTDKNGYAELPAGTLPYGTYKLTETSVPSDSGYLMKGTMTQTFSITEAGQKADLYSAYDKGISNTVIRGDFKFRKIDADSQRKMADVQFKVSLLDRAGNVVESHIITTDENGAFDSSSTYASHSAPEGIWFGDSDPDDNRGALVYGTYLLEELPCEANEGRVLYSDMFTISNKRNGDGMGYEVDLGNVENRYEMVISIMTEAMDAETLTHVSCADGDVTLQDKVTYANLTFATKYRLVGTLVDSTTGEVLTDNDGNAITATKDFTAKSSMGTVTMDFNFSGANLAGKTAVIYERLYDPETGLVIAQHTDPEDADQMIYFPQIGTTATDGETGIKLSNADDSVTIVDEVAYSNLQVGADYTVKGYLVDKATGEKILNNGEPVTAEQNFTAASTEGKVSLRFTFDGSGLEGTSVVAFETLYVNGTEVAVHADIDDENQTVTFPEIRTTAVNAEDGTDIINAENGIVTIDDMVSYTNLVPGATYTLKGTLMNPATGTVVIVSGKPVVSSCEFTPDNASGEAAVSFTFDASALRGSSVVAFEELYVADSLIASHKDLTDEGQTVHFPEIRTTASDEENGTKLSYPDENVVIIDEVAYSGLKAGEEYLLKGYLVDKSTGQPLMVGNEYVSAETTFTPEQTSGIATVKFTFDGSALAGTTVVAFEALYYNGKEVATHCDITDFDQSQYFPQIGTSAAGTDGTHFVNAAASATIVDTVSYENLVPGITYTVKGVLMDKEGKQPVLVDGKEITAETTFTPDQASGAAEVTFCFDASALKGKTLVVFEELYVADSLIALHKDLTDEDQTIYVPEIGTSATDAVDGDRTVDEAAGMVTINDKVSYTGLIPGETYTVEGILMDQATGEQLLVNGVPVTAVATFTAAESTGTVDVTFTFDVSGLGGHSLVVYEKLYYEESLIASHENLTDENQTITVNATPPVPQTGDSGSTLVFLILAFAGLAIVVAAFLRRRIG